MKLNDAEKYLPILQDFIAKIPMQVFTGGRWWDVQPNSDISFKHSPECYRRKPNAFTLGGREVEFRDDGSVRFSDGEVLSKDDISSFVEKWNEAGATKADAEWPKYFISVGMVYRCYSEADNGQFFRDGEWCNSTPPALCKVAKSHPAFWSPITKSQAKAIIGKKL